MKTIGRVVIATTIAGLCISNAFAQSTLPKAEHDSLWAVWSDPAQADTIRLEAIDEIARGYLSNQPDSAWHFAQLQYEFAMGRGKSKYLWNAFNTQGIAQANMGNYVGSLERFQKALLIAEELDKKSRTAASLANIGGIYKYLGDIARAMEYYRRSLNKYEEMGEMGDKKGIALLLSNIGLAYYDHGDIPKAWDHYQRSLKIEEELGNRHGIARTYGNLGIIYKDQGKQSKAFEYLQRTLSIMEELGEKWGAAMALITLGDIHAENGDEDLALDHFQRGLRIVEAIGDKGTTALAYYALGRFDNGRKNHKGALVWCEKSLLQAEEIGTIAPQREASQCLYDAYKAMGRSNEALVYLEKIGELDKQLNKEETTKKIQQMEFQQVMLQDSIAKAEETRLLQEAHQEEVRKSTRTRNVLAVSGAFLLLVAGAFYSRSRYMRRSRDIISKERDRSENLLLNILPAEIAEELKQKGRCEARDFDTVSILFTDFKNFTEHSATMSAAALVNEINHCFEAFDGIMTKYGIEKIKTIGDAYMAAGGLPVPAEDSVKNTVLAALEMQKFIRERKVQKDVLGEPAFEMRVGIHTGPVVAGIVGVKKFQYDLWGDTVNTASRMESSGVVGQVNISEGTYALLKDATDAVGSPLFRFTSRGRIEAKGKGGLEMYLVEENENNLAEHQDRSATAYQ
jgi:adenylate cyclase